MSLKPNDPCPCGGGKYKKCCAPLHRGEAAATAEALMRSRYSAYALGMHGYIIDTTDAEGPLFESDRPRWLAELNAFTRDTRFVSLEVIEHVPGADESTVDFAAKIEQRGAVSVMREKSLFTRQAGVWRYHSAVE